MMIQHGAFDARLSRSLKLREPTRRFSIQRISFRCAICSSIEHIFGSPLLKAENDPLNNQSTMLQCLGVRSHSLVSKGEPFPRTGSD